MTEIAKYILDDDYESVGISAEEMEKMFLKLDQGAIIALDWQSPGRISPAPETHRHDKSTNANKTIERAEPVKNDFDFSDDVPPTQMRVRVQNTTPKSVKKKMANFAGVMEVLKKKNAEN